MRKRNLFLGVLTVLMALFLGNTSIRAQVKVLLVNPGKTDPAIETVHGPNIALYDPTVPSRHLLYLFITGTGGSATGSQRMDSIFATWGYHAISLDYEDNVIAVACAHSLDSTSFGRYRDAIATGAPVSKKINVNKANSILNRFQKLLVYLVRHDPDGHWGQFVKNGQPVWSKVIVGGHSQGAGHAPYIAKLFKVNRVLIFSGPQDYMDNLQRPAPWQAMKSATPSSRYFAFLAMKDPFNVHHQIANCMVLMHLSKPDTLLVQPGEAIRGNYHILINNLPTKWPHASTLFPQFKNVWAYMLSAED